MRLDLFLSQKTRLSRHQTQKMIQNGAVKVAGLVILKPAFKIRGDEKIEYEIPKFFTESALLPEAIPLDILYEDEHIIVVNKPAHLVIHPAPGHPSGTLVNALLHRYGSLPLGNEELKPGIVHRLDKGTSGVMVVARTPEAMAELQRQFKSREVEKFYLGLVVGQPLMEGTIDKPLGRHMKDRQKMSSRTKKGREAKTEWKILKTFEEEVSWLEIQIHTGRTHQIRVHFSEAGFPLVGDPTYGKGNKKWKALINRPALHAWRLSFTHPATGEEMQFTAPIPKDLETLLAALT
ncbi:MAG: RluA family pseudouridine synthase [Deltaproteobacteria bacterium]|nr:RluA family pseudouridine synthase [Deltaproteobacteria bacterium]